MFFDGLKSKKFKSVMDFKWNIGENVNALAKVCAGEKVFEDFVT